jgi:hypothetical protein
LWVYPTGNNHMEIQLQTDRELYFTISGCGVINELDVINWFA